MDRNFFGQPTLESRNKSLSKLYCEEHPREKITNFDFTSLKPLCPSCLDPHYKMLRQNDTFPEVDTLKNVKTNCSKKVQNAISALTGEIMRLESQVVVNPREIIDSGIIAMNKTRDRVLQMVYKFFEDIEIDYTRRINETMIRLNSNDEVADKIRNLLSELEHLSSNIETPNCIQTIRKILMIDIKAMLDKLRNEVVKTLDYRNFLASSFPDVVIDEQRFYQVSECLSKAIFVQNKDDISLDQNTYKHNGQNGNTCSIFIL